MRVKKHNNLSFELSFVFSILLIVLVISGFAYSHWNEILQISGKIKMGHFYVKIGSYKAVVPKEFRRVAPIEDDQMVLIDPYTLKVMCENVCSGWYAWIGLVVCNDGTLPAKIKAIHVVFENQSELQDYLETEIYFYGPFDRGDFKVVWGHVEADDLPFNDAVAPPIFFDPSQKVIVWIKVSFNSTSDNGLEDISLHFTIHVIDNVAFSP
ncbi:MAG: hypothetical protein NDF55_05750 [archaeon GB-1867-005]|nr:hypothetical protein [Candidatus Culexmicrobium cathedralense]